MRRVPARFTPSGAAALRFSDLPPFRQLRSATQLGVEVLAELRHLRQDMARQDAAAARHDAALAGTAAALAELQTSQAALAESLAAIQREQQAATARGAELRRLLEEARTRSKDPNAAFYAALHEVGVLNYETPVASGEQRFLERYFAQSDGAPVLDVGANAGQFAELVRSIAPDVPLHCFEPHPVSFAALAERAGRLGFTPYALALSDQPGEIDFFDYADEAGSQHASVYREVIEGVHRRSAVATRVPCTTLDLKAVELGLSRIGLLKIDTEGHELAVLKGAAGLLAAGAVDAIQFEFNEMNVVSRVFMKDFFDLLPGYRIHRLLTDGAIPFETYDPRFMEIFAFQNIVCLRRDLEAGWLTAA